MIETYEVGVLLKLTNLISPQLLKITEQFEKLEGMTLSYKKALGDLAIDLAPLKAISVAANASGRAFEKAAVAAASYERELGAIRRLGGSFGAPTAMQAAALFGTGAGAGGAPPRGPRPTPLPGGGGGRNYHRGVHGGNIHMGAGGIGMGTVGMSAGEWFWPLAAAGATVWAGHSLFESAKDYDTEKQRFRLFGLSESQNREAFKYAGGMQIYGSTHTENLRNFREAQGVFREAGLDGSSALEGAKLAAPILSKLNALDSSLDEDAAANSRASNLAMLRYVESAGGLKSQAEFNRLANIGYKLKVGSGDTVDWTQLQQFQKRAGSAGINISGEGMARLEPSISTLGGSTAGTALATDFGRLQGIVKNLPVPVIAEFLKYGIWDKSKVALNSKGGISKFLDPRGPMSGDMSKLLTENPEGFYEQVIRPIYAQMNLDAAGVIRQNALIYGRTGGALANEWEKQLQTIQKAVAAFSKTKNIDQATAQLPNSVSGQAKEFAAAWTDFKIQFGTSMLPFFTGILKAGSAILRYIPNEDHTGEHWNSSFNPFSKKFWHGGQWEKDDAHGGPNSLIASSGGGNVTVLTNLSLDGQVLAKVVTKHQVKAGSRPQTGTSSVDFSQVLIPTGGMGFAGGF